MNLRQRLNSFSDCTAVQIGAHDGITGDPFREHLIRSDWQAAVIEPNPLIFRELRVNYGTRRSVFPINAAVSYTEPEVTLWTFDEDYLSKRKDWLTLSTLVSFSRDNMAKFVHPSDDALKHVVPLKVRAITVEDVVSERGWQGLDVLFVDVEGYENAILPFVQYNKLGVRIVVFENHFLPRRGEDLKHQLVDVGFETEDIERDTVAFR